MLVGGLGIGFFCIIGILFSIPILIGGWGVIASLITFLVGAFKQLKSIIDERKG